MLVWGKRRGHSNLDGAIDSYRSPWATGISAGSRSALPGGERHRFEREFGVAAATHPYKDPGPMGDPTESTPQQLKYLWHTLLAHGHDAERGHSAAHAPERRDGDTQR